MAHSRPDSREPTNINTNSEIEVFDDLTTTEFNDKSEIQISIDPISLKERNSPGVTFPNFVTPNVKRGFHIPPSLPPSKSKFLSVSLPNSASSSPRFTSRTSMKKPKYQAQESPFLINPLVGEHSIALTRLAQLRDHHLQRSKSCGEGRANAPSDDFDLWLTNVTNSESNFTRVENKVDTHKRGKGKSDKYDEEFKCGALCLYLPGFGKGKPVKERKKEPDVGHAAHVISRTVSLEKFECGSWASSAIVNDSEEEADASKRYFDLPLELIRSNVNDTNSPVRTAFLFDNDRKGVLKNNISNRVGRKSCESSRHVRFSTSSPNTRSPSTSPCITPRLRQAREDFNAFLEAQSA